MHFELSGFYFYGCNEQHLHQLLRELSHMLSNFFLLLILQRQLLLVPCRSYLFVSMSIKLLCPKHNQVMHELSLDMLDLPQLNILPQLYFWKNLHELQQLLCGKLSRWIFWK